MKMKRKLALLTSAALILGSLNVTTAFAAYGSGDVDGKDGVTTADADLAWDYVLDSSTEGVDAAAADVTSGDPDHGVTAKDVVWILTHTELNKHVHIHAGKVDGRDRKVNFGDGATTYEAARANARAEAEATHIQQYINDTYLPENPSESDKQVINNHVGALNRFLSKVYINDWKLGDPALQEFFDGYLTGVNAKADIDALFGLLQQYSNNGTEDFKLDADEVIALYNAISKIDIAPDEATIKANFDDPANPFWFRTIFQYKISDAPTEDPAGDDNHANESGTVKKSGTETYKGSDIDVAHWYYYNRAEGDKTTEQPFADNFRSALDDFIIPMIKDFHDDATIKDLIDDLGGDRIEITINKGGLPDVDTSKEDQATVDELNAWGDPEATYYFDFCELGYTFDGGSIEPDTESTTEAPTEAPTEKETSPETTTEAAPQPPVSGDVPVADGVTSDNHGEGVAPSTTITYTKEADGGYTIDDQDGSLTGRVDYAFGPLSSGVVTIKGTVQQVGGNSGGWTLAQIYDSNGKEVFGMRTLSSGDLGSVSGGVEKAFALRVNGAVAAATGATIAKDTDASYEFKIDFTAKEVTLTVDGQSTEVVKFADVADIASIRFVTAGGTRTMKFSKPAVSVEGGSTPTPTPSETTTEAAPETTTEAAPETTTEAAPQPPVSGDVAVADGVTSDNHAEGADPSTSITYTKAADGGYTIDDQDGSLTGRVDYAFGPLSSGVVTIKGTVQQVGGNSGGWTLAQIYDSNGKEVFGMRTLSSGDLGSVSGGVEKAFALRVDGAVAAATGATIAKDTDASYEFVIDFNANTVTLTVDGQSTGAVAFTPAVPAALSEVVPLAEGVGVADVASIRFVTAGGTRTMKFSKPAVSVEGGSTPTPTPGETTTEAAPETTTEAAPETTTEAAPETTTEAAPETTTEAAPEPPVSGEVAVADGVTSDNHAEGADPSTTITYTKAADGGYTIDDQDGSLTGRVDYAFGPLSSGVVTIKGTVQQVGGNSGGWTLAQIYNSDGKEVFGMRTLSSGDLGSVSGGVEKAFALRVNGTVAAATGATIAKDTDASYEFVIDFTAKTATLTVDNQPTEAVSFTDVADIASIRFVTAGGTRTMKFSKPAVTVGSGSTPTPTPGETTTEASPETTTEAAPQPSGATGSYIPCTTDTKGSVYNEGDTIADNDAFTLVSDCIRITSNSSYLTHAKDAAGTDDYASDSGVALPDELAIAGKFEGSQKVRKMFDVTAKTDGTLTIVVKLDQGKSCALYDPATMSIVAAGYADPAVAEYPLTYKVKAGQKLTFGGIGTCLRVYKVTLE